MAKQQPAASLSLFDRAQAHQIPQTAKACEKERDEERKRKKERNHMKRFDEIGISSVDWCARSFC